jgi:hypothetical protein
VHRHPIDSAQISIRDVGLPPKTRNALMEAGLFTLEAVEAASDATLNAIPWFGATRIAALRDRLRAFRETPRPAPRPLGDTAPARLPDGPALPALLEAAAGLGEPASTIIVLRLGLGPEGSLTRVAVANRLGLSIGIVERREFRAGIAFRRTPVVRGIGQRVKELAETERGRLAEALTDEPWADGMGERCLYRMALTCWGVNLRSDAEAGVGLKVRG